MKRLERHIKAMFEQLPRDRKARALRAEMLENARQRFEELTALGMEPERAEELVIEELGSAEELRERFSGRDGLMIAAVVVALILLVIALAQVFYTNAHRDEYYLYYNVMPILLQKGAMVPLTFSSGAFAILGLAGLLLPGLRRGFRLRGFGPRLLLLIVGIAFLVMQLISFFAFYIPVSINGQAYVWPVMLTLMKHSWVFLASGVLAYLGLNRG